MAENEIVALDHRLIIFFREVSVPVARVGLFVIFFWFGIIKLLGLSPASGLIEQLYYQTTPVALDFQVFYAGFALLECIIGILFLLRGMERVALILLFAHMITTFLPLFLMPQVTWQSLFVPTLEGQYIIKNLVIIAAAMGIGAHLHPIKR